MPLSVSSSLGGNAFDDPQLARLASYFAKSMRLQRSVVLFCALCALPTFSAIAAPLRPTHAPHAIVPASTNSPPTLDSKCSGPEATPLTPPWPLGSHWPLFIRKPGISAEAVSCSFATPMAKLTSSIFARRLPPLLPKTCISTRRATSSRSRTTIPAYRVQGHRSTRFSGWAGLRGKEVRQAVA